ncbi:MAG: rod shape-determining protein MreC [Actinobacteria bacterium]|nr:rod shape-determining protein MreC [Actinomycetota bacterium]
MYDKQVRRRRAVLALLVVVSLILLTAYFGESAGSPLHSVQRGVVAVLSPVQEGASRALKPVRDLFGWFGDTARAKKERDQLRKQRDSLLQQVVGYKVALQDNAELRRDLALDQNSLQGYDTRTVRVIGRPANNLLLDRLQVDAGSGAGVRMGDPVVADGGLVGHISFVAPDSSFVTLITDPSSSVSVKVLNTAGDTGLLKPSVGDPLDLLVQLLPRRAAVSVDDIVVTAGFRTSRLESLYPPNVPVGRVTKADPEELASDQQVHVAPIADLRHLDFVQILVGASGASGARAQVGP